MYKETLFAENVERGRRGILQLLRPGHADRVQIPGPVGLLDGPDQGGARGPLAGDGGPARAGGARRGTEVAGGAHEPLHGDLLVLELRLEVRRDEGRRGHHRGGGSGRHGVRGSSQRLAVSHVPREQRGIAEQVEEIPGFAVN